MRTVTLATFNDLEHARPVIKGLQEAGVPANLRDETKWQRGHLVERLASVKIEVDENEFETAKEKLKELDATEHWLDQAVYCPECGSADVDYPQVTRKFVL